MVFEWFDDHGYGVKEKKYVEKVKASGKEIEIKWECKRKVTDYFRFKIKIGYRILGLVEVEVQPQGGGEKIKTNKGDVEIKVQAYLDKDYEGKWEATPFYKFLRSVYEKYIIKSRVEEMEDKLTDEALDLVNNIKSFLLLEART